jgi:hypothetical protein
MTTSQKQTSLFTEETLTSLREDSHANHTATPGNDLVKKTSAICGQKCLEEYERFNRPGLLAKMFPALLIGTGEWYSTKFRLIWKLKATKSYRFYFQLVAKTLPHKRERVWFVAYNNRSTTGTPGTSGSIESNRGKNNDEPKQRGSEAKLNNRPSSFLRYVANTDSTPTINAIQTGRDLLTGKTITNTICPGLQGDKLNRASEQDESREQTHRPTSEFHQITDWSHFPTQSPVCSRNDGFSPKLVGITVPKHRNESIKGYGNAVVPQIPFEIFKAIDKFNKGL